METAPLRLRTLPPAARILVACFLLAMGTGFLAAQVNLRLQHGGLDGEPGLSLTDVEVAFHGIPGSTLITSKIGPGGSMEKYIPRPADHESIVSWVEGGHTEETFGPVKEVANRLCIRCHNPGGEMSHVPFAASRAEGARHDLMNPLTEPDHGMSYLSLARSSHAHLFGMGVLYALAGLAFLLTETSSRTKTVVVALPFVAMFVDIGCWWLTKLHPGFAVGVVAAGTLLGVAFAILIVRPLWELLTPGRSGVNST